jgi:hypothetical protein
MKRIWLGVFLALTFVVTLLLLMMDQSYMMRKLQSTRAHFPLNVFGNNYSIEAGNGTWPTANLVTVAVEQTTQVSLITTTRDPISIGTMVRRQDNPILKPMISVGMTADEYKLSVDILGVFLKQAERANIDAILYSGTLLGSWRHHGIVVWDDDVDIWINETKRDDLVNALNQLKPDYIISEVVNTRQKFYSKSSKKTNEFDWKWPFIDIQFFTENATHIWDIAKNFQHLKYKKSDMFPLHKRPFENFWIPAPRNSVSVLKSTYGKDLSPCYQWDYSHKKERFQKGIKVDCRTLSGVIPFVHRGVVNGTVVETLKRGEKVLHSIIVSEESLELITDPYDVSSIQIQKNGN